MDEQGKDRGVKEPKETKPKKPKRFKWKGTSPVTLPHVGRIAPDGVFEVNPDWEKADRLFAFVENNDKFDEVK